ncbi:MAG: hypothetical protein KAS94_03450, partial [Desulfobulbaceae bacterium]|nr:hypothetical protein [Desulfobulbaceae bacterium]
MAGDTRQPINRLFSSSLILLLIFLFLGIETTVAATKIGEAEPTSQASTSAVLPIALQQQESVELFKEIFKLSSEQNKTEQLERITELYSQIIQKYPDAPLAQESYFQLIGIF